MANRSLTAIRESVDSLMNRKVVDEFPEAQLLENVAGELGVLAYAQLLERVKRRSIHLNRD